MSAITKSLEKAPYWKVVIAYLCVRFLKARHPRTHAPARSAGELCVCLHYIGDNGPCPVHGKGA